MDDPSRLALAAKNNEQSFEELVTADKAWILRCASKAARRYITESDDEWSVALIAFSEAVKSYDGSKGAFHPLAAKIIKRRVIDELRREGKHAAEAPVSPSVFSGDGADDGAAGLDILVKSRLSDSSAAADEMQRSTLRAREEIEEMQQILKLYGFSFFDLASCSPKAEKTKTSCGKAIKILIASAILLAKMRLKRLLPIKELSEESAVARKILDRHRKYIIAAAEILDGDFPILSSYLSFIRAGGEKQ